MKYLATLLFLTFTISTIQAQSSIASKVRTMEASFEQSAAVIPFERLTSNDIRMLNISHIVTDAQFMLLIPEVLTQLSRSAPETIIMDLPVSARESIELLLYRVDVFGEGFSLLQSSDLSRPVPYESGHHYWGIVKGMPESIVAMSFFEDEIMGMIGTNVGNLVIGKTGHNNDGVHIVYNDKDLLINNDAACGTPDDGRGYTLEELQNNFGQRDQGDCIGIYIEIDDDILISKGGVINATNYITGLFNESFALFANDDINVNISEILAWDTPSPYNGTGSHEMRNAFQEFTESFNGDLAHLVSYKASGGVASGFSGLCNPDPDLSKCFTSILADYETVPLYSHSIYIVTHEMGHLMGSRHTHACVWNGDNTAIDGCSGQTEGDCPLPGNPPEGGTIMSYCNLSAAEVGINFNLGFGPQPGNVIRNNINATGNCLNGCPDAGQNDAGISSIVSPGWNLCSSTVIPEVTLKNFGTNTLTSATISYFINSDSPQSLNWSGVLPEGGSVDITLPELTLAAGSHTLTVYTESPNGVSDSNMSNDMRAQDFGSGSNGLTLSITLDDYPESTLWSISTATGNIIASGGPYGDLPDGDTVIESVCIPDGCFDFIIFDTFEKGLCCDYGQGSYSLVEDATGTELASGGEFGASETTVFCVSPQACNAQATYPENPLSHQGAGSSSTSIDFNELGDYPYFTISGLDQKLQGNPQLRYIDMVTVSYVTDNGTYVEYGTYSGADTNAVDIVIYRAVQSLTVTLENAYAENNASISLSMGPVTYCVGAPCPDDDMDGVCNDDDLCPGGDDNLDSDGDGIPDACDPCSDDDGDGVCNPDDICPGGDDTVDTDGDGVPDTCDNCPGDSNSGQEDSDQDGIGDACEPAGCTRLTTDMTPNPLTHSGTGSSMAYVSVSNGSDIEFAISGIDQKINGNPGKRYIEEVVVDVDGQFYAQYSGSSPESSVLVSIPGPANLIEVSLYDSYDGDVQSGSMSIDFSAVSWCPESPQPFAEWSDEIRTYYDAESDVHLFPNPSSGKAYLEFVAAPTQGVIIVRDILGRIVLQKILQGEKVVELELSNVNSQQILFVSIEVPDQRLRTLKLIMSE